MQNLEKYLEVYMPELGEELAQGHIRDIGSVRELLLLLYSVFRNYTLFCASEDEAGEEERNDMVLRNLRLHSGLTLNDALRTVYGRMLEGRTDEFLNRTYPALLEEIESLVYDGYDVIEPLSWSENNHVAKLIAKTLDGIGAKSVFDCSKQYVSISRHLSPDVRYVADFRDPRNPQENLARTEMLLLADVQLASRNNGSGLIFAPMPNGDLPTLDVDAVAMFGDLEMSEIRKIADTYSARYAVLEVYSPKRLRRQPYLLGEHLMRIDHILGESRYILVFDFKEHHSSVEYFYGNDLSEEYKVEVVPYEQIRWMGENLNTEVYVHPPLKEGMVLKSLGELAEPAVVQIIPGLEAGDVIPTYSLSSHFDVVCSPLRRPVMAPYGGLQESCGAWTGKNLHVNLTAWGKVMQCISRTEGPYTIDGDVMLSLKPLEDVVSAEYLAYELANNELFRSFMLLGVSPRVYLKYRIPIYEDRQKQKEIVRQELERLRDVVNSDGVYNVVCVGETLNLGADERLQLENWNVNVLAYTPTVYGEGGLRELMEDKSVGPRAEAILIDPMTDSAGSRLKGFQRALMLGRKHDIPVFAFSTEPLDSVGDDLEEDDLNYCRKGHYYESGKEDSLRRFITRVRNVLDNDGTLAQQIRMRHVQDFKAAYWIRDHWGIDVPSTLLVALSSPNRNLPQVRESVETLLKKIASMIAPGTMLDQAKGGWLAKFFLSRAREDNEKTHKYYVLEGKLMEKTLAASVDFMYQLLNGASHGGSSAEEAGEMNVLSYIGESGTQNLAMAVLHIYMDFIVWLASTEGRFWARCTVKDSRGEVSVDVAGIVRRVSAGEYYIETGSPEYGKIHFWPGKDSVVPDGTAIVVNSVTEETKSRDKYRWFASKWTIPAPGQE